MSAGEPRCPTELVLKLKQAFALHDFVECGTYLGATARWAAHEFERVVTIEFSRLIYDETRAPLSGLRNVDCRFGDSREVLRSIVPALPGPAVFWLDSHWSGGATYGAGDECPLLAELEAIRLSPHESFVLIDDARLFLSPPPLPHRLELWPSLCDVLDALRAGGERPYVAVFGDVILAVPLRARALVAAHCQELDTRAIESATGSPAGALSASAAGGWGEVKHGLHTIGSAWWTAMRRRGRP